MLSLYFCFAFCQYETKTQYEAIWLKVFDHDSGAGGFFQSKTEALNCSITNRYSILYILDSRFKINGKYEFLLEYPELVGYNRWLQTNSPIDETEQSGKTAEGYEAISITWDASYWGGLVKSTRSTTFLEGSTKSTSIAWYGIGYISTQYSPQHAGPGVKVKKAVLWVRTLLPEDPSF